MQALNEPSPSHPNPCVYPVLQVLVYRLSSSEGMARTIKSSECPPGTDDRFQNTAINKLGIYGSYTVGNWGCGILWWLYLPIGFAWLCERWYRILLIGCLCLSLGCDTWFTISYANA